MSLSNEQLPWEDFNKLHVVKRLRELIGDLWKIQVNFTDDKGYLRGVPAGKFFNPLHEVCKQITRSSTGFQGCMSAVRKTAQIKGKGVEFDRCHVGFSTISVPITMNGHYVGCIFCDGFIRSETEGEQKELIQRSLKNQFPNEKKLLELVDKLPVLTSQEIEFLTKIVELLVQEILKWQSELVNSKSEVETLKKDLKSRYEFGNLIGKSNSMQALYSLIDRIKDSASIILVQGENGTGKELVARALHYNSKRENAPFIAINCGAFNENLLESELFGHVKGSFTGAIKDKMGLFEAANGGTIFLDEVGEMPMTMQVKLLRVLQEGTFRSVGATETRKTTARVVCATNSDLTKMVEEGLFRKDLYFRLNVINVYIPPLRERMEDLPLLIEHFVKQFAKFMKVKEKRPTKECLKALMGYSWPGNVRELENEMERLYVLAGEESVLEEVNLSTRIHSKAPLSLDFQKGKLKDLLEKIESDIIREGLIRTQWNKSQLAKELGLSRAGLLLKIEKYGLDRKAS